MVEEKTLQDLRKMARFYDKKIQFIFQRNIWNYIVICILIIKYK